MKKRKIFRMIALLLSLTLLFSACSLGRSSAEESPPEEKNAAAQIVRKTIREMGSNISIEASYPETKAAGVDNIILSEIRQAIDDFRKSVGKQGGSLRINYEIYPGEGAIFSACYTLQATIGENKTESGFARTYNTAEDGVYAIKDFFPADGTAYLSLLSDTVRENAKSSGIPADNARFEAGTKADAGLYSSFILAQDKLIFVFPSGQIADYSAKVEVTLSVFGDSFQIGEASVKEPEQLEEVEFIPVDGHFTTTTLPQEETTEQTTEETTADNQTTTEAVSETTSGTTAETTTKKPDNG